MDKRVDQGTWVSLILVLFGCALAAVALSFAVGWANVPRLYMIVVSLAGSIAVVMQRLRRR